MLNKRIKKWNVYGAVRATKFLGVFEAATADEARQMAFNSEACSVSVCHSCSSEVEDPEIDEIDAYEDED